MKIAANIPTFLRAFLFVSLVSTCLGVEQEFRLQKPDAQSVSLAGEFNQWHAQAMAKQSDGTWTLKIEIPPGDYGYKFLVNGSDWMMDPNNPERKAVGGIENSLIKVDGAGAAEPARSPSAAVPASAPSVPASSPSGVLVRSGSASEPALAPSPGEILTVEVRLSATEQAEAAKKGSSRLTTAKVSIVVPPGFDPQKSWPVLIVNNTENYPNIDSLHQFQQAANDEGWIGLAADPIDAEKDEHGNWRWPCLEAALDEMALAWPDSKNWPMACGGMSGGAKNSAFIAADLVRANYNLIGMLMMGCNQDMATVAYHRSVVPRFLSVPVFLSSGKEDTIATPVQHEFVQSSLRGTGFQKVRLESHPGGHDIYAPHIAEALRWFAAQSSASPKASPASSFDSFFKKKP